jgi:hypothetical protein
LLTNNNWRLLQFLYKVSDTTVQLLWPKERGSRFLQNTNSFHHFDKAQCREDQNITGMKK